MSQPLLLKAYGNFFPVPENLAKRIAEICAIAPGRISDNESVVLEDKLLLISFEGIWFPLEQVLEVLRQWLDETPKAEMEEEPCGKLDILNLEEWTLERYLISGGKLIKKTAPLNNVMDFSGH